MCRQSCTQVDKHTVNHIRVEAEVVVVWKYSLISCTVHSFEFTFLHFRVFVKKIILTSCRICGKQGLVLLYSETDGTNFHCIVELAFQSFRENNTAAKNTGYTVTDIIAKISTHILKHLLIPLSTEGVYTGQPVGQIFSTSQRIQKAKMWITSKINPPT